MNHKKTVFLFVFIIFLLAIAFAQEPTSTPQADPVAITAEQSVNSEGNSDLQWIWGSITNLDSQAKTFTVKYFDYETDQEKEIVLSVDEKTVFENLKSLDELKIEDTLSVDYLVGIDNKNIAKNVSLEKPEIVAVQEPIAQTQTLAEPTAEALPVVVQPEIVPAPVVSEVVAPVPAQPETPTTVASEVVAPVVTQSESAVGQ